MSLLMPFRIYCETFPDDRRSVQKERLAFGDFELAYDAEISIDQRQFEMHFDVLLIPGSEIVFQPPAFYKPLGKITIVALNKPRKAGHPTAR